MNISFSGKTAPDHDTFGISFEAIVDGSQVRCRVTTEALQDIDPSNAVGEPASQFALNRSSFEQIADKLIRAGNVQNGQVFIKSEDLRYLKRG